MYWKLTDYKIVSLDSSALCTNSHLTISEITRIQ
jgi:hypothetical protein